MPNIHSISQVRPVRQDRFFVDSNVWFWFTYCASKEISTDRTPMRYQLEKYPRFIETALDNGSHLYHCPLVYTELANIIEKTEHDIYVNENGYISRKDFRALDDSRALVLKEIDLAWKTINSLSTCLDICLTEAVIPEVHALLSSSHLDSYDAFYLQLMQKEDIEKLITDDRDFVNTPLEDLYTANVRVLQM